MSTPLDYYHISMDNIATLWPEKLHSVLFSVETDKETMGDTLWTNKDNIFNIQKYVLLLKFCFEKERHLNTFMSI